MRNRALRRRRAILEVRLGRVGPEPRWKGLKEGFDAGETCSNLVEVGNEGEGLPADVQRE